jgi:phytoene dehydrogenase-like protein
MPEPFLADIRHWQSRSGTVKISLALDRLPVFASHPGFDPHVHGGTIVLAESLDDIENAFQQAVSGQPSAKPFADICIPSVFDDSLAPAGRAPVPAPPPYFRPGTRAPSRSPGRMPGPPPAFSPPVRSTAPGARRNPGCDAGA